LRWCVVMSLGGCLVCLRVWVGGVGDAGDTVSGLVLGLSKMRGGRLGLA